MIAVPGIRECLPRVFGDTDVHEGECVSVGDMSLFYRTNSVRRRDVTVRRGRSHHACVANQHSVAPCHRFTIWYAFNDTKSCWSGPVLDIQTGAWLPMYWLQRLGVLACHLTVGKSGLT